MDSNQSELSKDMGKFNNFLTLKIWNCKIKVVL
jgi:hypothetical protein